MEKILDYVKSKDSKISDLNSKQAEDAGFKVLARKLKILENGFILIPEQRIIDFVVGRFHAKHPINRWQDFEPDVRRYDKGDSRIEDFDGVCSYIEVNAWRRHELPRVKNFFGFSIRTYSEEVFVREGWIETLVERYNKVPPSFVYEKLKKARVLNLFDHYVVAELGTLDFKEKDPLILGRLKNDSDRFFICQYDDDIQLDNLI